jgi:hypothetical protein
VQVYAEFHATECRFVQVGTSCKTLTTDQKVSGSTPDGCASKNKDLRAGGLRLRFCGILFREGNSGQPCHLAYPLRRRQVIATFLDYRRFGLFLPQNRFLRIAWHSHCYRAFQMEAIRILSVEGPHLLLVPGVRNFSGTSGPRYMPLTLSTM